MLTPLLEIYSFEEVGANDLKLKEKNILLHPINVVNMHWAFLHLNVAKSEGLYLDSMKDAYSFPM